VAQKKSIKHHEIVGIVAERIRNRRKQLGMSQLDLAQKAQISITYIGNLERGESSVGIDMLARIASSMDSTVSELVSDSPVQKPQSPEASKAQLKKTDRQTSLPERCCFLPIAGGCGRVDG